MTTVTTPLVEPGPAREPRAQPLGRVLFGVLLIGLGASWLLDATGVLQLRWATALSVALMAVGAALLASARSGSHGGLVFLGIVLTPLVVTANLAPAVSPFEGVGEREYRPATVAALQEEYELGAGPLRLDLRDLVIPAGETVTVAASVGMGELTVAVPDDVTVQVRAESGAGDVDVLGAVRNGVGVELDETLAGAEGGGRLVLDLAVGLGAIEVTR